MDFIGFCENFNIKEKTTAPKEPWSNGICERHNAMTSFSSYCRSKRQIVTGKLP